MGVVHIHVMYVEAREQPLMSFLKYHLLILKQGLSLA